MPKKSRKNWNQDYYKVGGSEIGSRDQARLNKDKLAHQKTELRQGAPLKGGVAPHPGYRTEAQPAEGRTAARTQAHGEQVAKRPQREAPKAAAARATPVRAPRAEAQPAALVRELHQDKPRHGKKRRAGKKRHEVGVIQEMRQNPQESPQEAAERLRTQEKPLAEVVDVRQAARRKSEAGPAPSQMPDALPAQAQKRVEQLAHRAYDTGRKVYDFAKDLVTAPATIVRVFRALRHREA